MSNSRVSSKPGSSSSRNESISSSSMQKQTMVTLEVCEEKEFPSLCSFPHGVPKTIDTARIVAKRKRTEKISKTNISFEFDSITYKGSDYGEYSWKKNLYNYAVGVLGTDGKIKVYPCTQAFIMRPDIAQKEDAVNKPVLSAMEKRESLTNEFGSKKKKRMMNAAKSNTISTDNISGANDLKTILTAKSGEQDISFLKAAEDVISRSKKKRARNSL